MNLSLKKTINCSALDEGLHFMIKVIDEKEWNGIRIHYLDCLK